MKRLDTLFIGKWRFILNSIFMLASLLLVNTAQAKIYDDFKGTTIDSAKWGIFTNLGPPGQFWQDDGLYYSGSTGNDAEILTATKTITQIAGSNNCAVTIQFKGFNSTTSYPPDYMGPASGIRVSLNPLFNNEVISVSRIVNPIGDEGGAIHQFAALYQDITGFVYGFVTANTSATSGQLRIAYVNGLATVSYNETLNPTTGWHQLATFTPAWGSDSPSLALGGSDSPNGTTTFEIEQVSLTSAHVPPLLLLFD